MDEGSAVEEIYATCHECLHMGQQMGSSECSACMLDTLPLHAARALLFAVRVCALACRYLLAELPVARSFPSCHLPLFSLQWGARWRLHV